MVARFEFWALFLALLAVAQLLAELYLASFGSPGMTHLDAWSAAGLAYAVRHLPMFVLVLPLGLLTFAVISTWVLLFASDRFASARHVTVRLLAICLLACVCLLAVEWPARGIRRAGFVVAADRMAPLVAAIDRFETETGRPPYELAELTPRYLLAPETFGVRGCRSLQYSVAPPDKAWRWQVWLECPNGMLTLDRFFFRPKPDYSDWGNFELVGEWAYNWD